MASFIAKQMMGKQLDSVKGVMGDKEEGDKDKPEEEQEEDPEIVAARREIEEKRAEKHRKAEEERETMRQGIRDKYGLKKKEKIEPAEDPDMAGRLGRKKKTSAELAAENDPDAEDDDDFSSSILPKNLDDFKTKVSAIPGSVVTSVTEATEKCVLQ